MSGIVGAFDSRGRLLDGQRLALAASGMAYRASSGVHRWHGGPAALARVDRAPWLDAAAGSCIAFDGWLDNRDELARLLEMHPADVTDDAAVVLAAYGRWGHESVARLRGDFSLLLWDGRARRMLAARDVFGVRPLFYRQLEGTWWWASDQRTLARLDLPAVNDGYLAEYLSDRVTTVDETIFQGLHRLPPAHAMLVDAGGVRRWRYWQPAPEQGLDRRAPEDLEEQFRSLLEDAVRVRLRSDRDIGLMLSGGIDSSSIAVQIARLRDGGDPRAARVRTFSMVIPGHPADEAAAIASVLGRVALPSALFPAAAATEWDFARDAAFSLDLPEHPNSFTSHEAYESAAAAGCPVVLTGVGGDEWFDGSYPDVADLLRTGRAFAACRWLANSRRASERAPLLQTMRLAGWMALPDGAKSVVRTALGRNPVPAWIAPDFARRCHLADRIRRSCDDVRFDSLAQRDAFFAATGADSAFRRDQGERVNARRGVRERYPFFDRRLVEFALGLPLEQRRNGGRSKVLMRQAMRGALTPEVTGTPPRSDFGFFATSAIARLGGLERLRASEPVRRGWLRAHVLDGLYQQMESGATRCLWPVWATVSIDLWLRAIADAPRYMEHEESKTQIA